jgi:hypothetical protein
MGHGQCQVGGLPVGHAPQVNGHQPRCCLVVGDIALRDSLDEEFDLFPRQFTAVALLGDYVRCTHASPQSWMSWVYYIINATFPKGPNLQEGGLRWDGIQAIIGQLKQLQGGDGGACL